MKPKFETVTTWNLWECERGNRWSLTPRPENGQNGDVCEFSGCTHDGHTVRIVKQTQNRTEAHNWFRRVTP